MGSMIAPVCTKCNRRTSFYLRPYSGERLCPECFNTSLKEKVQSSINRFSMLEHDSRVVVGLSGGKDSITLLHILKEIEDETHGSEIIAVTIDEGISGYRDEALKIAKMACKKIDIEWLMVSFHELFGRTMDDIAHSRRTLGACSFCGVLRRRALNEAARRIGADRVATGHTLDDMAQTVLLNLLRGDISKIPSIDPGGIEQEGFIRRIKPLCEVPERETTLFTLNAKFDFQNASCPFSSEAMREDVRKFLSEMERSRPGTMFTIFNTALKLMPSQSKNGILKTCLICGEPASKDVCRVCELLRD